MAKRKSSDRPSPELTNGAGEDLTPTDVAVLQRRMSGEDLKDLLRQQRREARLKEKGY